jgi:hypothetical protein
LCIIENKTTSNVFEYSLCLSQNRRDVSQDEIIGFRRIFTVMGTMGIRKSKNKNPTTTTTTT